MTRHDVTTQNELRRHFPKQPKAAKEHTRQRIQKTVWDLSKERTQKNDEATIAPTA